MCYEGSFHQLKCCQLIKKTTHLIPFCASLMILSNYMLSQISCSDLSDFGLEIDMMNDYLHLGWLCALLRFLFCVLLTEFVMGN